MTRLVWIELLKLRSTRLSYGLLAAGAALSILSSAMGAARAGGAQSRPFRLPQGSAPSPSLSVSPSCSPSCSGSPCRAGSSATARPR